MSSSKYLAPDHFCCSLGLSSLHHTFCTEGRQVIEVIVTAEYEVPSLVSVPYLRMPPARQQQHCHPSSNRAADSAVVHYVTPPYTYPHLCFPE